MADICVSAGENLSSGVCEQQRRRSAWLRIRAFLPAPLLFTYCEVLCQNLL